MDELEQLRLMRMKKILEKNAKQNEDEKMDKPIILTDGNFDETIGKGGVTVVDCWAAWCGPCRMIGPIIEELAKEYAGRMTFGKLNVDENQMIPGKYAIMSIPTLLVFKEGKLVDRIIGALPKQMLEPKLTQYLN